MTSRSAEILSKDRVAVITGAASGIGAAAARKFASLEMRLALVDRDEQALDAMASQLNVPFERVVGDISDDSTLSRLRDAAARLGNVALLLNNAGVGEVAGPWDGKEAWRRSLDINLLSMVETQHLFVPGMLEGHRPAAIVNLGSKQGITTPPGNAVYNAGKAAVKVLSEQLAHELLKASEGRVTAHLLIPGYTWTPMNFPGLDTRTDAKPDEAWTAEQVVDRLIERMSAGDFYIVCPDNAVTPEIDAKRIRWASDDIINNRPALSRWHPDWKSAFDRYMRDG